MKLTETVPDYIMVKYLSEQQPWPPHTFADEKQVLQSIVARPWFRRRWVIQETLSRVVNGKTLMGNVICSTPAFRKYLESHDLIRRAKPLKSGGFDNNMLGILFNYDESECTDPRDCIFALRGLGKFAASIRVDYNRDVRETYLALAKSLALHIPDEDSLFRWANSGKDNKALQRAHGDM